MGGHQYRKMLSILRNFASNLKSMIDSGQKEEVDEFLCYIKQMFVKRALQIASWNSSSTDRNQVYKYKHALNIDTIYQEKYYTKYNYHSTSNASDIKEKDVYLQLAEHSLNQGYMNVAEKSYQSIKAFSKLS